MIATPQRLLQKPAAQHAINLCSSVAILLLCWYLWPASLGGHTRFVVVQGDSMEPTYQLGDALIVKDNPHPQVGEIIVFHIPADEPGAGMLVVHRVRSIRPDGSYETQGDNRQTADRFQITDADIMGTPAHSIPRLGRLVGIASNPLMVALAAGAMATLLLWPKEDPASTVEAAVGGTTDGPEDPDEPSEPRFGTVEVPEWSVEDDIEAEAQAWLAAELAKIGCLA